MNDMQERLTAVAAVVHAAVNEYVAALSAPEPLPALIEELMEAVDGPQRRCVRWATAHITKEIQ